MEKTAFMACLFLSLAVAALPLKSRKLQVYTMPVMGVFEVAFMPSPNKMSYGFNASQAREVCRSLDVTIASKAEVEEALRNGLETCRFGWIDEQVAVIPRINPSSSCGKNGVGVIVWRAAVTKLFDVFCFNSSALQLHLDAKTTDVPVTTKQAPGIPSATSARLPQSAPSPSQASVRLPRSTRSALLASLSTPPAQPDRNAPLQPMSSTESSFGVVPTAVVITVVTALLLILLTALWRNRKSKNSIPLWKRAPTKDGTRTEVWKSTCDKELNWAESEEDRGGENSNISPNGP